MAIVASFWDAWLERRLEKQGEMPEERRLLLRYAELAALPPLSRLSRSRFSTVSSVLLSSP